MGSEIAFLAGAPGPGELVVLFLVILVLFGPRRLPEIARMIGRTLEELRRASYDFRRQVMDIERDVPDTDTPSSRHAEQPRDVEPEGGVPPENGGEDKHDLAG